MPRPLRSCQRQARSLRRWLELSQEEPGLEDQEAAQRVQEELQEVRGTPPTPAPLGLCFLSALPPPPPTGPRWNCRSGSWSPSSRPSASPPAPALPASRP